MAMTLLERFDADPCWQAVPVEKLRRAIAVAQAVDELDQANAPNDSVAAVLWQIRDRADEMLKPTDAPAR